MGQRTSLGPIGGAGLVVATMAAVGVFGVAWVVTDLEPFSPTAGAAVIATAVLTIAYGLSRPAQPRSEELHSRAGIAGWAALFAAVAGWQLAAFLQHPRADHPTLSSLTNSVLDAHLARTVAFVAWLALGVRFARR